MRGGALAALLLAAQAPLALHARTVPARHASAATAPAAPALHAAPPPAPAPRVSAPPPALLFHRFALPDPAAVCNDGSRAQIYVRNCTANHDRAPGDPTDYCAGEQTLVFTFLSGPVDGAAGAGAFCYDARSCAARAAALTSSAGLPATLFAEGLTLPYPEVNPNLYKQHSVIVPYCTSDLFAGAARGFSGARVADAAVAALSARGLLPDGALAVADRVVLVGGAGVMARLDALAAALRAGKRGATGNASAALAVFGICDGCLLHALPPPAPPGARCATDADCPTAAALPALAALAGLARPPGCAEAEVWACYAAPALGRALAAAATPALVIAQQFDARQLAANGAAPAGAWAADTFAPAVRAAAAAARFAIAPACAAADVTFAAALFDEKVVHVDAYGNHLNSSIVSGLTTFLEDASGEGGGEPFGSWVDSCGALDCAQLCNVQGR